MLYQVAGVLLVGIAAGFIGAVSGGGGLISIPFLLFLGVPPQITLATSKFGGLGMNFGGTFKYIRNQKVVWKYAIGLAIAGVIASYIGSRILISINTKILNTLIGILLIVLVPTYLLYS